MILARDEVYVVIPANGNINGRFLYQTAYVGLEVSLRGSKVITELDRSSNTKKAAEHHLATPPLTGYKDVDAISVRTTPSSSENYRELFEEEMHCCFVRGYN